MDRAENALFFILDKGSDNMERGYFAIIPANVRYDKELTANAKLLYGEITALCNDKGFCWATNQYFADLYDIHPNSISRLISQLEKRGYIKLDIKKIPTGYQRHIFIVEPQHNCEGAINNIVNTPHDKNVITPINKKVNKNNTKNINNTTINNTSEYIGEFETLWSIYPNKKGREQALKAYIKARKAKVEYETIKIGLQKYIKYVQIKQTEKQYIKHGSTFFNQHAWADEYDLNADRPKGIFGLIYDEYQEHHGGDIFEQERGNESFSSFTELLPEPFEVIGRGQHSKYDSADMGKQF
jgi:hypothetical protein